MSELMTVAQVAAVLNCSEETVTRRFSKEKGVIDLAPVGGTRRRRYRVLRIPRIVVEKYALQHGGRITVPDPPVKLAKPAPTEDALVHDLATLSSQHGEAARQTLERITRRAKAMTHVTQDRWVDMVWLDED